MAFADATYADSVDGPAFALADARRVFGPLAAALATVAATLAVGAAALFGASWLMGAVLSTHPHYHGGTPLVPELRALADRPHLRLAGTAQFARVAPAMTHAAYARDLALQAEFHRIKLAALKTAARPAPPVPEKPVADINVAMSPQPVIAPVETVPAKAPPPSKPTQVAALTPPAEPAPSPAPAPAQAAAPAPPTPKHEVKSTDKLPLPPRRPADGPPAVATHEIARTETGPAAPELTTASLPPPETPKPPPAARDEADALAGPGSRTAVYDIAAHTVYMPDGERLEAHSGIGFRRDNPRYVARRNRGPTPPNVYKLSLRERRFHGVRAIRLTPLDEDKMFGRDGMLAHTYMLGRSGQSNGCVSFKHYRKFLRAFLKGRIERLVVVKRLKGKLARAVLGETSRYALND